MVRSDPPHPIFDDPYLNRDRDYDPGIRRLFGWWPLTQGHVPVFWTLGGAPEGMHIHPLPPYGPVCACHVLHSPPRKAHGMPTDP